MRLTEKEVIRRFKQLYGKTKPLKITVRKSQYSTAFGRIDAIGTVELDGKKCIDVAIEFLAVATPKNLTEKAIILREAVKRLAKKKFIPLIVAPYIGPKQMKMLDKEDICWIDLCGNMKIQTGGGDYVRLYIEKTGNKNKYPDTVPIKKIFQGKSSLVGRALLLKRPGFKSQNELVDFINNRNANITASTVSRVLKSLEEELLVNKTKSLISVADAEKLLDSLLQSYRNERKIEKRYRFASDRFERVILYSGFVTVVLVDYVAFGFYAAKLKGLAETDELTIFVKEIEQFRNKCKNESVDLIADSEFGNLTVIETRNPSVWFNINTSEEPFIVDDIELYIEMMNDKPRGPKVAEILKEKILKDFKNERERT